MENQRKIGVILNYVQLVLRILTSFWVTKIVVTALGMSEYGLIALSGSVLAALPLLAFGMEGTIPRFVAEYRARNDLEGLNNFLGICQKFFYAVTVVAIVACCFLYFQLRSIFPSLTPDEFDKVQVMYLMLSAGAVVYFSQCIYNQITLAYERFLIRGILQNLTMVLTAVGSVLFVMNGYGAVGVTAVGLAISLINVFPYRIYCWKKLRIRPNLRYWNWELMKKCFGYSLWVFLGTVSGMFGDTIVPLIIGSACTPADVGIFKLGALITSYFYFGSNSAGLFLPRVVEMVTHNAGRRELTDICIKVGRLDFMMGMLFAGGFILLGEQFFALWLSGKELEPYVPLIWLAGLFSVVVVPVATANTMGWQVMRAKDLLRFRVVIGLIPNVMSAAFGYVAALWYGLFGLLWCRFFFQLVETALSLVYFEKAGRLDMLRFMKETYFDTLVPAVVGLIAGFVLIYFLPVDSWPVFILAGSCYTLFFVVGAWVFTFRKQEKDLCLGMLSNAWNTVFKRSG